MRGSLGIVLAACLVALVPARSYAQSFYSLPEVNLTAEDYQDLAAAYQPLLNDDTIAIGTTRAWSNPNTGNQGTVQLVRRFDHVYEGSTLPCRELREHFMIKGNADPYNVRINRCKVADGTWKIL